MHGLSCAIYLAAEVTSTTEYQTTTSGTYVHSISCFCICWQITALVVATSSCIRDEPRQRDKANIDLTATVSAKGGGKRRGRQGL